jgi:S-adenosylmethionine uptake transporter
MPPIPQQVPDPSHNKDARHSRQTTSWIAALISLTAFGFFATADALIKLVSVTVSIPQIMLVMASSVIGFGLFELCRKRRQEPIKINHPRLLTLRAAVMAAAMLFTFTAFKRLPLSDVYTILFTMPLIVTALAPVFLGEQVGVYRWGAVIVGFGGVVFAFGLDISTVGTGHGFAFAGATCFAVSMVLLRRISAGENAGVVLVTAAVGQLLASALLLILPGYAGLVCPPSLETGLLVVICVVSVVGQRLLIAAYRRGDASIVATMQYSQMVWGIVYGYLLFGNLPTASVVVGALIVIACGIVILLRERQRATAVE